MPEEPDDVMRAIQVLVGLLAEIQERLGAIEGKVANVEAMIDQGVCSYGRYD